MPALSPTMSQGNIAEWQACGMLMTAALPCMSELHV